jgi:uncharacterized delta-60 repeat protein
VTVATTDIHGGSGDVAVERVAYQQDGKILVVGTSSVALGGGTSEFAVVRLMPNGQPDPTFGDGGVARTPIGAGSHAYGVTIDNLGRIVVVGSTDLTDLGFSGTHVEYFAVARYKPDGTLDTDFGQSGTVVTQLGYPRDIAYAAAIDGSGRIVVVGTSIQPNTGRDFAAVRYKVDGSLDSTFGADHDGDGMRDGWVTTDLSGNTDVATDVAIDSGGRLVIAGMSRLSGARDNITLVRYSPEGSLDTDFGDGGRVISDFSSVSHRLEEAVSVPKLRLAIGGEDRIVLADGGHLIRYDSEGNADNSSGGTLAPAFGSGYAANLTVAAIDPNGGVYVADGGGSVRWAVAHYDATGVRDMSYGIDGLATADFGSAGYPGDLAVSGSGRVVVAGVVANQDGLPHFDFGVAQFAGLSTDSPTFADDLQATVTGTQVFDSSSPAPIVLRVTAANIDDSLSAVAGLAPNTTVTHPVPIVFDLGGSDVYGPRVSVPDGVTLYFEDGNFYPHSPALTVTAGTVIVRNCTLTDTTDTPTVLVIDGNVTFRNDVIQESTGYAQSAIQVAGGTVDLGTSADAGGNTINVNGAGTLIRNDTDVPVTARGNTWQADGTTLASPSALLLGQISWKVVPTVIVTGGSFAYDEHGHPATGSVTDVNGESFGTPSFTYSLTEDNGNVITSTAPPVDPGYYTVTASFAGNDNYSSASATTTITIYYDVRTLTDLSKAFNAGRTIPIKLQLTDAAGNNISSANIGVWAVALYRVNADGSRTQVSLQDAGGSNPNDLFRYDSSIGGYIFNLSTKGLGAGTYVFDWMAGDDPTTHELGFKLV